MSCPLSAAKTALDAAKARETISITAFFMGHLASATALPTQYVFGAHIDSRRLGNEGAMRLSRGHRGDRLVPPVHIRGRVLGSQAVTAAVKELSARNCPHPDEESLPREAGTTCS